MTKLRKPPRKKPALDPLAPRIRAQTAIRLAGNQNQLAALLDISRQAVNAWGRWVPATSAYKLRELRPEWFNIARLEAKMPGESEDGGNDATGNRNHPARKGRAAPAAEGTVQAGTEVDQ